MPRRIALVIVASAMLRIAGGASGVLVGLYLAKLADERLAIGAALVGLLSATSFGAELTGAIPLGILADAIPPSVLAGGGALVAACAVVMFGLAHDMPVFFVSRFLEGLAAAAVIPPLLAQLVDDTAHDAAIRARAMSYFELSLLAGLGVGGVLGSQLWRWLASRAFDALALVYVGSAAVLFTGAARRQASSRREAYAGLLRVLREPAVRRLAPMWLSINVIVGLWIGPTAYFLLTRRSTSDQLLDGLLTNDPQRLGWLLLGYSVVFAAGLIAWSIALPRTGVDRALRISLLAMLAVSAGLFALNHSGRWPSAARWTLTVGVSLLVMVESGFTPAALSLLGGAVGPSAGRGAAMGIYSFLLGIGAVTGSIAAGILGSRFAFDGLIGATFALAVLALTLLPRLSVVEASV